MSDLIRWQPGAIARLPRPVAREVERVAEATLVAEAMVEGQARVVEARVDAGARLADRAIDRVTYLDEKITRMSQDKPGLELGLREIQADFLGEAKEELKGFWRARRR